MKRATSAGGLVVRSTDGRRPEVALIRHRTPRGKSVWTLPKGALEDGESIPDAALREVREETGLEAEIIEPLEPITYWFAWKQDRARYRKTVHHFLMRAVGGDISHHDDEVEEVRFFAFPDAIDHASYPSERKLLRTAADRVARW